MAKERAQLLAEFKRNKANRRPSEIERLLRLYGFTCPRRRKGHAAWKKGKVTLTVPDPHGGERVVKVAMVVEVIRKIEEARALEELGAETASGSETGDEEDA